MSREYFTLLVREPGDPTWRPEFGDYDRAVVTQERDDIAERGTLYKIIETGARKSDIDAAVAALNAFPTGVLALRCVSSRKVQP